ncbi:MULTISPECIES: flagellar assembly protein FliH [Halomonadaceae]|uniref:Flagellar assembly protein FliH n=1 Tax=Vreelandella titanicae TaxID=664683 RepID=A0A558J3B2_9GAMM|nr:MULTISPECIES: flagellar assembly protein FliH [Halomonas]MBR9902786.1 flagellar assembly protein FliH [Gammaproteobacteria bacterium]TVU88107.1 flagellar assembly protein FliH [Halomonas titanicae]CEP38143.1 Flagellar assembly protein fliH [Halomonas sp. R57-5]
MSNTHSPKFDRHGDWRRWQMEELATTQSNHAADGEVPTAHQRKVQAAQKAAEQARQREESERQALHERIRQQAEKEGYNAGFEKGRKEGLEKGLEEAAEQAKTELEAQIRKTVAPLETLGKQFADALEHLDDTIAYDLVELALATGRQLASDALQDTPEQILVIVRELLHTEPPLVGHQRLWLNPDDHTLVEEHLGNELRAANWKLQPDDQLARGGCRVTSAQGEIDATFESRWHAIQAQSRKRGLNSPPSSNVPSS